MQDGLLVVTLLTAVESCVEGMWATETTFCLDVMIAWCLYYGYYSAGKNEYTRSRELFTRPVPAGTGRVGHTRGVPVDPQASTIHYAYLWARWRRVWELE